MPGVVVLGMHRSGTSAITRALNLLGLATCNDADLLGPDEYNTKGHWESATVTACNEILLWHSGSAWWVPPRRQDWLTDWSDPLVQPARDAFAGVHGREPWVLKDPRLCLTLPLWMRALDITGVVIALRHPSSVAQSILRRGGMELDYAFGLWERHMRWALSFSTGLPAFITSYDELLDQTADWTATAAAFLDDVGLPVDVNETAVSAFMAREMRHFRSRVESLLSPEASALWHECRRLTGVHRALGPVDLPDETQGIADMFEAARPRMERPEVTNLTSEAFRHFEAATGRARVPDSGLPGRPPQAR